MDLDKVVVENLPEKFPNLLHPETHREVKWLWEDLSVLHGFFASWQPKTEQIDELQIMVGRTILYSQRS